MNKKALLPLLVFSFTVPFLSGCNKEENITVNNLKSAVKYICKKKNYTLSYSGSGVSHNIIFTSNSIGLVCDSYVEATDIHIQDKKGVYRLRYNNNSFIGGEILYKGVNLWSSNFYHAHMLGVSTGFLSDVDNKSTSLVVKDKKFMLSYAYTIGYNESTVANINSLTLTYNEKGSKPSLTFTLSVQGGNVIYTAHDFGTSKNKIVDNYLSSGGTYLTPSESLNTIRDLVKGNNFIQSNYYFGETVEESGYIGNSYFHPHYYARTFFSSTGYDGYIALNSQKYGLKGCYTYVVSSTEVVLYPTPLYSEPDIVTFMHYPSFLKLWDNYEYLTSWTNQDMLGYEKKGDGYFTDNISILNDFADNFSITSNFQGQRPLALAIDTYIEDGERYLFFYYKFSYSGYYYVLPIPLFYFGKANIQTLDKIYKQYND